jgi:hypothetical protein
MNAEEAARYLEGKAPGYLQRTSPKRVAGTVIIDDPLLPGQEREAETKMCMHCQMHFIIQPGSEMKRGFCTNCNGVTCGKQKCETVCTHFEKAIEIMEGRDPTRTQF